jgi:hypothetical protein
MGNFTEEMNKLKQSSEREQIQSIEAMKTKCICPDCPTYNNCAKSNNELLYCIHGESKECIQDEKRCICQECPITQKMGLKHMFFCTRGNEEKQLK